MEELLQSQELRSGHMIRAVENLKRLGQANVTLGVLEAKISAIDKKWELFCDDHTLIERAATGADRKRAYFAQDVYQTTEDNYFLNKGKMLDLARQLKGKAEEESHSRSVVHASPQLPKIALPSFSGAFSDWPSFRDLFTSMVGDNPSLSPIEKLHYLKMSLTEEPAALIATIPLTADNLKAAWKTLTDRYENIRLLTNAQLSSIHSLQPMRGESSAELKTLFNGTVNAVSALRALGRPVDGYSDWLVFLTVLNLDNQSRREWEMHVGAKKTPPTFAELQAFLETRICAIQALEPAGSVTVSSTKAQDTSASGGRAEAKHGTRVKAHQASASSNARRKCPVCDRDHYLGACERFRSKNLEERRAIVRSSKRCFNCLGQHNVRECTSQRLCQTCNAKHHTLLHEAHSNAVVGGASGAAPPQPTSAGCSSDPQGTGIVALNSRCSSTSSSTRALLATAEVTAFTAGGDSVLVRALLDQGSEASFVSESLAQRLSLPRASASVVIAGIGGKATLQARGQVTIKIASRVAARHELQVRALVLPRLTSYTPPKTVTGARWRHLDGLPLADSDFSSSRKIDLLLGAEVMSQLLLPGVCRGGPDSPIAQNTKLGWILSGVVSSRTNENAVCTSLQLSVDRSLSTLLQRFWEQEELTVPLPLTSEEEACEAHFASTHTRGADGRYIVRLPVKKPLSSLGHSYAVASRVLSRMEQHASRDEVFASEYSAFLTEYETLGHMELVPLGAQEPSLAYYLPHHGVTRESSETTKFRVVFNGSQKTSSGVSLNDCLHVGPQLLPDLFDVVLRWRRHAVVFSADMEKMYRQVLLHPEDRDFQRILWRKGSDARPRAYRLCTVTYGLACAPYLALRVIRQLANDEKERYPRGSEALLNDVYVDDVLSGADDLAAALEKQREIVELLKAGGFSLRKWTSSSSDVLSHLSPSLQATGTNFDFSAESAFRMLGLSWQAECDSFVFEVKAPHIEPPLTKRKILSTIASLFDPLGWLAPVVVSAKIFLQSLWLLKLEWDDPLPSSASREWTTLHALLPRISDIRVPRWLNIQSTTSDIVLHGFSDASERAYAAVVYLVVNSSHSVSLVVAKTKVAPVKQVSLPRLELCAAQLLAKLTKRVLDVLALECPVYLWSDSTVTLSWIRGHPGRWKTYVANRVSEIQRTVPHALWRHVGTAENPADCASRGILASELHEHPLWWTGPRWLLAPREDWPSLLPLEDTEAPEERLHALVASKEREEPIELLTRYSSLDRLLRIVAWCLRFAKNSRSRCKRSTDDVTLTPTLLPVELDNSLVCLVKIEQLRCFRSEVAALLSRSVLPKGSLSRLNPFVDSNGQLRVGGRLKHAILDADEKNPVIVSRGSPLARLLTERAHEKTLHGGTQLTLATLRQRFWILSARALVRSTVGRCIRCLRFRAATASQLMGVLPKERVTPSRPFFHAGVDYAGPILIRTSKGRGHKSTKAYIAVFVCFATRAVHLEAVSDYSADAFLAAYKRFTSRRGLCRTLSSDCGTNFVGADAEMRSLFAEASVTSSRIANALASDGVEWKFNPPSAPHFGGLWEAAVKSVKHHLRRVIGETTLTFEEMATLLAQIEACLNSRPLSALTDDPDDLSALTPGHFIIGAPLSAVPEPSHEEIPMARLSRWQQIQQMRDSFWRRWSSEYLHQLQMRPKWNVAQPPLCVGDLVLVVSEISPPTKWPLARIIATHPGGDGQVRVVTVKTATSTLKRPIVKLCVLAKSGDLEKSE